MSSRRSRPCSASSPTRSAAPYADIELPSASPKVDWEAELTIVIGREARGVDPSDALDHVAGYTVANDVSMRDWQNRTLQWLQGKNFQGTTPVGPVLVTPDEIDHAADLRISCTINDEVVQDSRTSDLIFPPAELVVLHLDVHDPAPGRSDPHRHPRRCRPRPHPATVHRRPTTS